MKIRFFAALLLAALTLFSGCAAAAAAPPPTQPTLTVMEKPTAPLSPVPPTEVPAAPTEMPTLPASAATEPARISRDEAITIALQDAGFSADQVTRLKAELDYDDGQPEYEVEFHRDGWEYDYEIHAVTGQVLHKDKDWDD